MRSIAAAVAGLGLVALSGSAAQAAGSGPSIEPFENNDAVWACQSDGAPLPPHHCINVKSQGSTGVIKVFSPDERWPQEGVSTDPKSDSRPCPHDPLALDGTWWSPVPGLWVCHHRP
jgi:hypothetical protein